MPTLDEAAQSAGLIDPDLLKIAKPGLHADAAVADLKRRYPQAFQEPLKHVRDMTKEEIADWERRHGIRSGGHSR